MNTESFRFHLPTVIHYGAGCTKSMREILRNGRVLLVCDSFLYRGGIAQGLGEALQAEQVAYFSEFEPNPTTTSVDACAEAARALGADAILGLGGGSAMDVAKAVACLTSNPGSLYDYYAGGTQTFAPRKTRLILVPTTAGTGSEVTNVGVFNDPKGGKKAPFVTEQFWADDAFLDPELTYSLPPAVTAATGMDAFCHAMEAYWNRDSQPICDALAMAALRDILTHLETAYTQPEHAQARGAMLQASLLAGVAFSQTRTTGVHALSFPLTTEFHASHGVACAITLPAFLRVSVEQKGEKMRALAAYLGYEDVPALADAVEDLMKRVGLPVRLGELGVCEQDLTHLAQVGLEAGIIHLTPAVMNEESVRALLRSIL